MSLSPSSFVLGWDRGSFARMEEGCMEKASGGTFARTTRNTDEDEYPRKPGAFLGAT
jgi:hypothetical protein